MCLSIRRRATAVNENGGRGSLQARPRPLEPRGPSALRGSWAPMACTVRVVRSCRINSHRRIPNRRNGLLQTPNFGGTAVVVIIAATFGPQVTFSKIKSSGEGRRANKRLPSVFFSRPLFLSLLRSYLTTDYGIPYDPASPGRSTTATTTKRSRYDRRRRSVLVAIGRINSIGLPSGRDHLASSMPSPGLSSTAAAENIHVS